MYTSRLVKRLFCNYLDIEDEESCFSYEPDTPIDEKCVGCLPSRKREVINDNDKSDTLVLSKTVNVINQLIQFLSLDGNIKEEGIFRKSGSLRKQEELTYII